ncbi:unnamed protein product [Chondrus crispus]|uniref:pyridoxal kinase n=1 Tax=Chondrus crispus TaxID=2769 RepID=R7QDV6_CHOCR|nr:unnamed protein product [Chondrus crispus]CDF36269.1 unnamed protein product [Chondrus crispus]|eukprot:XP_005716088.1 unnamed protein product [Chondrus crispus]
MCLADASNSLARVLSIQSHVVSGYVGNKAAVFPLQLLGYDVDVLPSVTLANHTGYAKGAAGPRHTAEEVAIWLEGLRVNNLLADVTHLLTGYIGTPGALTAVVDAVQLLRKEATDKLVFLCDPVLGDDGKLYVHENVVKVYVDQVLPLATILTPNAFELGVLTGRKIETRKEAFAASDYMHDKYSIPTIIVTGTRFDSNSGRVAVLVSSWGNGEDSTRFALTAEFIDGSFTGTGDLLAALLLAWTSRLPGDLVAACRNAMASVTAVLKRTVATPRGKGLTEKPELKLIQSQREILKPPVELVKVEMIST